MQTLKIRHFLVVRLFLPFSLICLVFQMTYPFYLKLHCSLVTCVEARERLSFGPLPWVRLSLPPALGNAPAGTWAWSGAPAYKNERLAYYQGLLKAKGITDPAHLRLLTAQLVQEAGSLSESTVGDHGCSFGILQFNACAHAGIKAAAYLKKHPEWTGWQYQLDRMADMVADRYAMYDGNILQTVVHHNRPTSARAGRDTPAGYFRSISHKTSLLTSL
jgi:hypothetical protein